MSYVLKEVEIVGSLNQATRQIIPTSCHGIWPIIANPINLSTEKASKTELALAVKQLHSRLRKYNPDLPTDFPSLLYYLDSIIEIPSLNDSDVISQDIKW